MQLDEKTHWIQITGYAEGPVGWFKKKGSITNKDGLMYFDNINPNPKKKVLWAAVVQM